MLRYLQKIKAIEPDNADIRLLQQLVEQRRQLVEDKRRFVNRIINTLKQYYPQPLEWFSVLCCEAKMSRSSALSSMCFSFFATIVLLWCIRLSV